MKISIFLAFILIGATTIGPAAPVLLADDDDGPIRVAWLIITPTTAVQSPGLVASVNFGETRGPFEIETGVLSSNLTDRALLAVSVSGRFKKNLGLALVNPDPAKSVNVNLSLADSEGTLIGAQQTINLNPFEQTSRFITDIFPAGAIPRSGDDEFEKEIGLLPPTGAPFPQAKGKAEVEVEGRGAKAEQEFEVEVEKLPPGASFTILVTISGTVIDFGSFLTDMEGKFEVEFSTDPDDDELPLPALPPGKTVADIGLVQIKAADGKIVLEGNLSGAIPLGFVGTLLITADGPIAILALRFNGENFMATPLVDLGATSFTVPTKNGIGGAGAIVIPIFAVGGGFRSDLDVINPTAAEISGRVDFFGPDGKPLDLTLNGVTASTFNFTVPARGVFMLAPKQKQKRGN